MKRFFILILGLLLNSVAAGAVSMRICQADGTTPLDTNAPIMVGTKLTIYVDSNSAAAWVGGLDLVKAPDDPVPPIGKLFGRSWDPNLLNYVGSKYSAAGIRAKVVDWVNQDQQSFELFAKDPNIAAGTWFVLDYNAMNIGDCTLKLVEYHGADLVVITSKTIHQIATRDFNHDGKINFADFAKLASYWLHTDCNALNHCDGTDLYPDGKIDFIDVAYFAEYWLGSHNLHDSGSGTFIASSPNQTSISMQASSLAFSLTQGSSSEQMSLNMEDSQLPPIYLTCDTNSPDPNEIVTVYVHSDAALLAMDTLATVTGDATITAALKESEMTSYGWDRGWHCNPTIDANNGWLVIHGIKWDGDATGVVGYFKFRYHSGQISVAISSASHALSWDEETGTCPAVPFSTEPLIIGRDPNEL